MISQPNKDRTTTPPGINNLKRDKMDNLNDLKPLSIYFSDDGTRMYYTSEGRIHEYELPKSKYREPRTISLLQKVKNLFLSDAKRILSDDGGFDINISKAVFLKTYDIPSIQ